MIGGIVDVILEIVVTSPDSGYNYHEVNVKKAASDAITMRVIVLVELSLIQ